MLYIKCKPASMEVTSIEGKEQLKVQNLQQLCTCLANSKLAALLVPARADCKAYWTKQDICFTRIRNTAASRSGGWWALFTGHWWGSTLSTCVFSFGSLTAWKTLRPCSMSREGQQSYEGSGAQTGIVQSQEEKLRGDFTVIWKEIVVR